MKIKLILIAIIIATFSSIKAQEINCEQARKKYLEKNIDVANAGVDAWIHYTTYGKKEGRNWPSCEVDVIKNSANNSISKKLGNYEIIISNEKKSWNEVNEYCKQLGKGWFIPSKNQMTTIVERFSFSNDKILWTSNEGTSGSSNNYAGKQWTNNDYDVAKAFEIKTTTTIDLYKTDKADYVIARSLGNCFEIVKDNLNSAYTLGDIIVSKYEMRNLTFNEAKNLCKSLGDGWRLPTIEELEQIKNNGKTIEKDLDISFYYSESKTCDDCYDSFWGLNLDNGKKIVFDKTSYLRVLPVYSTPKEQLKTFNFGSYEVCINIYGPMTFSEANSFCSKLSDNPNRLWRITNAQAFFSMIEYKQDIPGIVGKTFMYYNGSNGYFERNNLSIRKIEPIGINERYSMQGNENESYYFFIAR